MLTHETEWKSVDKELSRLSRYGSTVVYEMKCWLWQGPTYRHTEVEIEIVYEDYIMLFLTGTSWWQVKDMRNTSLSNKAGLGRYNDYQK